MGLFDFWRRAPAASKPAPATRDWDKPGALGVAGAMKTDVGRVRASNEDAVVYFAGAEGDSFDLAAAVADGMGGHAAGEVASELAIAAFRSTLKETRADPATALAAALHEANRAIREHARAHPETAGMGTTCTAALVRGDRLWLGHVGDSRAYLFRAGALTQLSEDHTLRAQLIRDGTIAEDDTSGAAAGLLMRALGAAEEVEPMLSTGFPLAAEDRLLLCSDGLHGVVADELIASALAAEDPAFACEALVQAAHAAGAPDNVSVGVFRFRERPVAAESSSAPTRPYGLPAAPLE